MRLFQCGYCKKVLSQEKWVFQEDLLVNEPITERIYCVCPACFCKRGEADFFKKER